MRSGARSNDVGQGLKEIGCRVKEIRSKVKEIRYSLKEIRNRLKTHSEKQMIKKFGKDETPEQLPIIRGRSTLLNAMLVQLQVGESLFLPREDWKTKNGPYYVISHLKKTTSLRFEYGLKTDRTGWLFKRIA